MADVQPSNAPRKTAKKNTGWMAALVVLGLAAAGVFFWLRSERSTNASGNGAEFTLPLETFVVNLNGSGQRGYLRVGISLGSTQSFSRGKAEAIPTALVRDTILNVLATAQPEELVKLEGKRQLKDNLLQALREKAPQLAIDNVYFTEFLVQM